MNIAGSIDTTSDSEASVHGALPIVGRGVGLAFVTALTLLPLMIAVRLELRTREAHLRATAARSIQSHPWLEAA